MKYNLQIPKLEPGQDFARDSFWWTYVQKIANPMRFKWQIKKTAFEWFDREESRARLNGTPFPPPPVITRKITLPQPWDGKDEKPGRVPQP